MRLQDSQAGRKHAEGIGAGVRLPGGGVGGLTIDRVCPGVGLDHDNRCDRVVGTRTAAGIGTGPETGLGGGGFGVGRHVAGGYPQCGRFEIGGRFHRRYLSTARQVSLGSLSRGNGRLGVSRGSRFGILFNVLLHSGEQRSVITAGRLQRRSPAFRAATRALDGRRRLGRGRGRGDSRLPACAPDVSTDL